MIKNILCQLEFILSGFNLERSQSCSEKLWFTTTTRRNCIIPNCNGLWVCPGLYREKQNGKTIITGQTSSRIKFGKSDQNCSDCTYQRKRSISILLAACKNMVERAFQKYILQIFDQDRFWGAAICWLLKILNKKPKAQSQGTLTIS